MNCPDPFTNRFGDVECPACGRSWEPWDGSPLCEGPRVVAAPRPVVITRKERTRAVAERELQKIRSILTGQ